ncbi:MAG: glycosyltransferase, partial [Pedobacter sp.]
MKQNTLSFVGYELFSGKLGEFTPKSKTLINTLNLHSYVVAENDSNFKKSLLKSDVLLADGEGAVLGLRFLTGNRISKIAGADLHRYFLESLNSEKGKCFYLGASSDTLDKIISKISVEYPNVTVGKYSPPYKNEFDANDNKLMIDAVNTFKPDVLFVGMTAPKQEKWVAENSEALEAKFICTIGAVFDFYAGTVNRPSQFWINLKLEWLLRLIKEPKRMWRRYLYNGPV